MLHILKITEKEPVKSQSQGKVTLYSIKCFFLSHFTNLKTFCSVVIEWETWLQWKGVTLNQISQLSVLIKLCYLVAYEDPINNNTPLSGIHSHFILNKSNTQKWRWEFPDRLKATIKVTTLRYHYSIKTQYKSTNVWICMQTTHSTVSSKIAAWKRVQLIAMHISQFTPLYWSHL